jgi:hypothetical protein
MIKLRHLAAFAALAISVGMAGCGGGGGGGGVSSGTRTVGIYVTDGFDDQYSQVWVTLYRIEVSTDGTSFQTIFEDPSGKTINLARLANSAEFLGAVSLPNSSITQVRVVIADHFLLVPKGGGNGQSVPVDSSIPTANGKSTITFDVTNPGSHRDLIIDFDLASFQLISGKVRPHVKHGDDNQFQHHEKHGELEGIVSNLTSSSFDLVHGNRTIHVTYDLDTTIFHNGTGAVGTLANGQRVHVKGTVNAETRTILATSIKIQGGDDDDERHRAEAEGIVESVNTSDETFVLTLHEAENFDPVSGTVNVVTTGSTHFERKHHVPATFDDIVAGLRVDVAGVYNEATNTLTATRVKIKD